MRKRNRVRSALALLLAAALALTGPAQSIGPVQAASEDAVVDTQEEAVQEAEKTSVQTTTENETNAEGRTEADVFTQDSQTERDTGNGAVQKETTAAEETAAKDLPSETTEKTTEQVTEEMTGETNIKETDIEETGIEETNIEETNIEETGIEETNIEETGTEQTTINETAEERLTEGSIVETTQEESTEEMTEETSTEEMTEAASTEEETEEETVQEIVLTAQEKEDAAALTVNQKEEFVLRKDEESGWYSFTPEEDGAYALKMVCDGLDSYDYWCVRSGVNKIIDDGEADLPYKVLFFGEAGETVYFQPIVSRYVWEDYEIAEVKTSLEIAAAAKGTVTADGNGDYTLSYNGVSTALSIDTTSTTIRFTAGGKEQEAQRNYYLGVYCSGVTGRSKGGTFGNAYQYTDHLGSLDINTEYHL